jgi:hypothetical protein
MVPGQAGQALKTWAHENKPKTTMPRDDSSHLVGGFNPSDKY